MPFVAAVIAKCVGKFINENLLEKQQQQQNGHIAYVEYQVDCYCFAIAITITAATAAAWREFPSKNRYVCTDIWFLLLFIRFSGVHKRKSNVFYWR